MPTNGDNKGQFLKHKQELQEAFLRKPSGLLHASRLAKMVDAALERIIATQAPANISIAATGGYGRGLLCPHSDIDLLFMWQADTAGEKDFCKNVVYSLWDLGLKVSHSYRSIPDTLSFAREDVLFRTSLIDLRPLHDPAGLINRLQSEFKGKIVSGSEKTFISAKLAEMDVRHHKLGDSRYFLEPNVKEGKGGLRDLNTLYWLARYSLGVGSVQEMADVNFLTGEEVKLFQDAEDFLLKTRIALHYLSSRAEDRLIFDHQLKIAPMLGFKDSGKASAGERFMKRYFLTTARVSALARIFSTVLEERNRKESRNLLDHLRQRKNGGFKIKTGRLMLEEDEIKKSPALMMRIFKAYAESGMDIHPEALRIITRNLKLIPSSAAGDKSAGAIWREASTVFLDILTSRSGSARALRLMNDIGLLARIIPAFGRISGAMQYDMYHVYTVDEHTLQAVSIIHDIENGLLEQAHPLASTVISGISSRLVLYLGMLLHDVAKGRGGNHTGIGGSLALNICRKLRLDTADSELVAWLVENHLLMTSTVFKRDIFDSSTITEFAGKVMSLDRLKMLLIITVADIKAVGPNIWNEYKAGLLRSLYQLAASELAAPGSASDNDEAGKARCMIMEALSGEPSAPATFYINNAPENFLMAFEPDKHLLLYKHLQDHRINGDRVSVFHRVDLKHMVTELVIITADQPALFAIISGVISLCGGNIIDAKAFTLNDCTAVDVFTVQDMEGKAFDRADRIAKISAYLELAMNGELDISDKFANESGGLFKRKNPDVKIPTKITIDTDTNPNYSILEVNAADRQGLLYSLCMAVSHAGFNIDSAFISTYGNAASDVFYISGVPVRNPEKIEALSHSIYKLF